MEKFDKHGQTKLKSISFLIRPYQVKDKNRVIDLWIQCGLVVPANNPALDIDRKTSHSPELLVGEMNDVIIASVMIGYEGHRGWINYLAVDPAYQRRGYARQMMDEAEKRLNGLNCPKINLQVRESNTEVIQFYEKLGYKNDHVIGMGKRLFQDPAYEKQ